MNDSGEKGMQASVEGFAHEHIVAGILMKIFKNVSLVDLPLSPYDVIIVFKEEDGRENIIRAQVKTAKKSISFIGGTRGGIDRSYKSGVKEYKQSTKTSDVVIGIRPLENNSYDLFFLPTVIIEILEQKSISINKIQMLKNNYEIFKRCKDSEFVISKFKKYGIIQ